MRPRSLALCLCFATIMACGGAGPQPVAPPDAPIRTLAVAAGEQDTSISSFADLTDPAIRNAAVQYPARQLETAAPISLTAGDGSGLELVRMDTRAVVEGPLAFTEMHLDFKNPADRTIEGRFSITLPAEATISRLAMRIEGQWQEAEVVERQAARRAYEDFLHRNQDPALLEKEAGNEFSARIFPIPAKGIKEIIVSYSEDLIGADATYRLHQAGLPTIEHYSMQVRANGKVVQTDRKEKFSPTADLAVSVPFGGGGLINGDVGVFRVRPQLSNTAVALPSLTIMFDTSASRALSFVQDVKRLEQVVAALKAEHGGEWSLQVIAFDQTVTPIYQGLASGFDAAATKRLLTHRPLGASNLNAALEWVASHSQSQRVLLIGDGIATAGPTDDAVLSATLKRLARQVKRLDVLALGGIRDDEALTRLARGSFESDGVIVGDRVPTAEVVTRLSRTTVSGLMPSIAGAQWVYPEQLNGLQPGDEALVYAAFQPGKAPTTHASIKLRGPVEQELKVDLVPAARPLLQRAAVHAEIARLTEARAALLPEREAERKEMQARIVQLSTEHRVLSDFTALLVLETDEDYRRFGIAREALRDILVATENGLEVRHRNQLVIAAKEPPPERLADKTSKKKHEREASPDTMVGLLPGDPSEGGAGKQFDFSDHPDLKGVDPGYFSELSTADEEKDGKEDLERRQEVLADPRPEPARQAPRTSAGPRPSPPPPPSPPPMMRRPPSEPQPDPTEDQDFDDSAPVADALLRDGPSPLTGRFAEIQASINAGRAQAAAVDALAWRGESPKDVMALIALGSSLEALGERGLAARAYGSLIDLFPSRADIRRFASSRLANLGRVGIPLAVDSLQQAVQQRPDHLTGHRALAYALLKADRIADAFAALEVGILQEYPSNRFAGGIQVLREDIGIIGALWLSRAPEQNVLLRQRLQAVGAVLATKPSTRFVLYWETDANDVDFHIFDGKGNHASYQHKDLRSGGRLFEDITTGYGPECFAIAETPQAFPYRLMIHYYSRGPMGYGMGHLDVLRHDGGGAFSIEQRPYVVMNDDAYVDLGVVTGPMASAGQKQ